MPGFVYPHAMRGFATGQEDWSAFTYKFTFVDAGYIPAANHQFVSAFSNYELSSISFTAHFGGSMRQALTSQEVSLNFTSFQVENYASLVSYEGLSAGTIDAYIILRESGTDALSPLIVYFSGGDFPFTTNAGDVVVTFANSGVFVMRRPL